MRFLIKNIESGRTMSETESFSEALKFYRSNEDHNAEVFDSKIGKSVKVLSTDMATVRAVSGLSQVALCKEYNIPTRTVTSWETDERHPASYIIDILYRLITTES